MFAELTVVLIHILKTCFILQAENQDDTIQPVAELQQRKGLHKAIQNTAKQLYKAVEKIKDHSFSFIYISKCIVVIPVSLGKIEIIT